MSEDETDIEDTPSREHGDPLRQRKRVRRVELAWRSMEVGLVLRELDHYYREQYPVGMARPGNSPRERLVDARRVDQGRVVHGLPHNFYNEMWLSHKTAVQRNILGVEPTWSP